MIWLAVILALIILILFLPVSLCVYYSQGFKLFVKVLFFKFSLPTSKKQKSEKPTSPVKENGQTFMQKLNSFKTTLSVAKSLIRALSVKKIKAHIVVSTDDPCSTALLFGGINAAIHTVAKILKAKTADIQINADYNEQHTTVLFNVDISTCLLKLVTTLIKAYASGKIKIYD